MLGLSDLILNLDPKWGKINIQGAQRPVKTTIKTLLNKELFNGVGNNCPSKHRSNDINIEGGGKANNIILFQAKQWFSTIIMMIPKGTFGTKETIRKTQKRKG